MTRFGAVIFGCAGPVLSSSEKSFFSESDPFGFILFNRNIADANQLRGLCAELRAAVGREAPIFIDQEGGRVQRLRPPLARDWRPPLDESVGPDAERAFYLRARIIAHELRALGIDGNCIPTLDIARPGTHAVLRNRCYGTDVDTVVRHGRAVVRGCLDGGVLPVMKHMPGHGLGTLDSHHDLPRVDAPRDLLDRQDFAAFAQFADLPLGMSAHLVFEAIDPRPATVSPVMVEIIRRQIGFGGLLMTDDISMQALSGTVADRAAAARAAGCDVVLHCNGDLAEMQAIVGAVGPMDADGQRRAEAALAARCAPVPVDIAALEAEAASLTFPDRPPERA